MNSCFNCEWGHSVRDCKLPKEKEDVGKMMASLMRYGYSINEIKAGLRIFTEGEKNGNYYKRIWKSVTH